MPGIPSVDLHGNLSQVARDRNLASFASGETRVLVATDVAARGVHVDDIELVIHVDPPAEHKAYLHRSGRTARAGKEGEVVTIMLPAQRKDTADLLRKAGISVTPQHVTASSDAVVALVGEVAAYVKPAPRAPEQVQGPGRGRSQGANAQRKRAASSDGAPRRDRSGRPAASGSGRSGSGRAAVTGERRPQRGSAPFASSSSSDAPRASQPARTQQPARTEQAPSRPRGGNGRAQATGGPIKVGQVVRANNRGR